MRLEWTVWPLAANSAHAANEVIWESVSSSSTDFLNRLGCGLRGTLGSFVIGFGVILVLWEFFVQKQGHMLVIAIVGILGVLILGRVIAPDATCT